MIPVTKPHLPDRKKLAAYIDGIYERGWLTNNGPLVQELTRRLETHLGVENVLLVANGTLALQIAFRTLGVTGSAVTTPFSFVATTSALQWEGITPVFADIDPQTLCIDPKQVEAAVTQNTSALVPVHVFGNSCDVEALDDIAQRHNLKTIYDGAHAFGVNYKDRSLLSYGDAATLSFHATKLFHSIEGGAIIFKHKADLERARLLINFGYDNGEIRSLGINAKMSEFHAAMGLCVLDEIKQIQAGRSRVCELYREELEGRVRLPIWNSHCTRNHSYFPVLFDDEAALLRVQRALNDEGINPRRYFYPSLDSLDYIESPIPIRQPVASDIARRVLCLPLYPELNNNLVHTICQAILQRLAQNA